MNLNQILRRKIDCSLQLAQKSIGKKNLWNLRHLKLCGNTQCKMRYKREGMTVIFCEGSKKFVVWIKKQTFYNCGNFALRIVSSRWISSWICHCERRLYIKDNSFFIQCEDLQNW